MKKALFIDSVHPSVWQGLEAAGYECVDLSSAEQNKILSQFTEATGIVIRHRLYLGEPLLKHAPNLKWVARSGTGMDAIDVDYCNTRGIRLINAKGANAAAVGEFVVGQLLCMLRNIPRADAEVRQGIWQREANRGLEISSRTIGIIGYGHTGRALAKALSGFGPKVLAYDKYAEVDGPYASKASLAEIQAEADVLSFHVPLTEETKDYFDADFLKAMRRSVYLINASRGPVCDLDTILAGLESESIIKAALDVLPREPRDGGRLDTNTKALTALIQSNRVLLSPHIAGWTEESKLAQAQALLLGIQE